MAIELREFAERVLFGSTIEEKLCWPREEIVDTRPGDPVPSPLRPDRPASLALREKGVRAAPPSVAKLIDERQRGRLLHFFGNHELLATELMALALLKFPDAPGSFRRGLLETLKDEQIHTRIYMHRMEQCGVSFGELPLSDYFWRSVSSMEDPLDYVTRLSLTFEQANLDYSREYARIFRASGDNATAGLLEKIYRDEIGHVGFGLRWFRRWKRSGASDWEAYRNQLSFPLSPARAKGRRFNAEGRSAAGFDDAYIRELQVFSQSRGRTPTVRWFNPEAERFAAEGAPGAGPTPSVLQDDLGFLPAYLARAGDILVLSRRPTVSFLQGLLSHGLELPELLVAERTSGPDARMVLQPPLIERKLGDLQPWAWTPDSIDFFRHCFSALTRDRDPGSLWSEGKRQLFSKLWLAGWGRDLAEEFGESDWLAPAEVYGCSATDMGELQEQRRRLAALGYGDIVCKASFGTAAQGNRCLKEGETLSPAFRAWLEEIWEKQGVLVVEPWLRRVLDFSAQAELRGQELKLLAFTRLINNARGQFRGVVANAFSQDLEPELARFLMQPAGRRPRIYAWYEETVWPRLAQVLVSESFAGPLGLDAFAYRAPTGELRLKPLVELNPRLTMGRIACEISARIAPRSTGMLEILTRAQLRKQGHASFASFAETLSRNQPFNRESGSRNRVATGSFAATDPAQAQRFLAVFHARARFRDLPTLGARHDYC